MVLASYVLVAIVNAGHPKISEGLYSSFTVGCDFFGDIRTHRLRPDTIEDVGIPAILRIGSHAWAVNTPHGLPITKSC